MRWAVTHWLSWLAAAILIAGAPLLADDHIVIERPGAAAPLNSLEGKDNTAGVYVRDSAIALEEFALAQRMERLREWGKSADVYQEILEKYPDRVVPAPGGVDADNRIIQYTSVTEAVRQALCRWPQQGLDVYRAHYQTAAAKLLASAKPGDMSRLHEVFSLYFVTDTAKTAGITMMDNYFEQGDYAAVAQIGHRLLDWHPNLLAERPMVLYRTALAEKLCGDITAARAHLAELRQNFAAAVGTIRGTDVELADSLEQELSSASGVVRAAASDSWLTVGGDPSRAKVSSSTVKPGARLYSIPLTPVTWAQVGEPSQRHNLEQQDKSLRDLGAGLGVMPAVDHGELFFQDNVCIYAVSLDSGVPLSGWANTYPNGVYRLPVSAAPLPTGQQLCVTLTDQYVTAVMGLPDHLALSNGVAGGEARLVCLDRHSGAELWNTTVRHAAPDSQSNLRDLRIGGAPLVVGDNLYILGRGGKGPQFEDCYVLCFRVATGQFCWASYIASANSDQAVLNPEIPVGFADAISHIAYASGRLYVLSNLGAAAALDAYTGTVIWLDIYRDQPVATANAIGGPFMVGMQSPGNVPPPSPPWIYNPVMVQNGRVFILPNDNDSLFIYDADTGKQIKRIWLSDFADSDNNQQASKPDTLLCVNGDVLYLGSPSGVCRLPWEKYDHTNNPKPSGYWVSTEFYTDETSSPQQVRGRSFVTADAVYVPTIPALRRVLLKSGMIDPKNERFPRGNWDQTQEGPGNVLATADHVIIAGDRHVAVYTDIDLARLKLDREVAAAPADPEPRLNYAEVMFVGGQAALAEDKLNEAFELLGGQQNLRPGPLRDRGFADAMNFAVHLSSKANTSEEARAQRLFDLAQAAAQSPSQQVAYRLARARFELLADRAAAAVELYQQILFDSAMRVVSVPDPDTSVASQAGIVAEKAIGQIVRTPNGRAAYDKFEQAAAAKLAEAQASNDPAKLLEVAKIYPNAQVARPAMMAAADVFEAQGNPRLATLVLQQLLNKSPDQDRAAVLEAMARNYLKMPRRLDVAVSRLALAAAAAPAGTRLHRPLPLPDGTVLADIPLTQARDLLSNFAARISTDTLPDLCLPTSEQRQVYQQVRGKLPNPFLSESPDTLITGVDALIVPMEGFARNDRIVTWDARSGLSIYPIGTPLPICRCSTVTDAVRGAAWMEGALLAWTSSSAFLIDGQKGAVLWQVNLSDMPAIEVISDSTAAASSDTAAPDNPATPNQAAQMGEQIVQVAPIGDRVVFGTSTGRIFAVASGAGGNGHVVWQTRVAGHAADALLANDDFTVVRFHDDQNVQLIVLRSFSGELAGRKSFGAESGAYPINMALGADGTLVYTMPDHLCIQDLYEANLTEQGMEPKFSTPVSPQTPPIFFTLGQPNQLIVHGGRAFAVSNQGNLVRVYSLDTGKPWSYHSTDATGGVPGQLSTESSGSSNVTLHISGNFLYVLSPQKLVVYRVDFPDVNWRTFSSMSEPHNFEQVLFGRDYLVILDRCPPPLTVSNKRSDHVRLQCCNRAAFKSMYGPQGESGRLVYEPEITGLHGPDAWQAVEGGIVYFNAGTVHTLLGARRNMPTTAPAN